MMIFMSIAVTVVLVMMLRSAFIEYQYYQSVKACEPSIWQDMGSPSLLTSMWVFIGFERSALFSKVTSEIVRALAVENRRAGIQFIKVLVVVLVASIVFFKLS